MTSTPEIIIHDKLDEYPSLKPSVLSGCTLGLCKGNEIHILDKDLIFRLILEHELIHFQRSNTITSKIGYEWRLEWAILLFTALFGINQVLAISYNAFYQVSAIWLSLLIITVCSLLICRFVEERAAYNGMSVLSLQSK